MEKYEKIEVESSLKDFNIEVAAEITKHIANLSEDYLNKMQSIFKTYSKELGPLETSVVLGLRFCNKQVIKACVGHSESIIKNIEDLKGIEKKIN